MFSSPAIFIGMPFYLGLNVLMENRAFIKV